MTSEQKPSEGQPQHSLECLYVYALSRLGLEDSPALRALWWDAHGALIWDDETDTFIPPQLTGRCATCGMPTQDPVQHWSDCSSHGVDTEEGIKYLPCDCQGDAK